MEIPHSNAVYCFADDSKHPSATIGYLMPTRNWVSALNILLIT